MTFEIEEEQSEKPDWENEFDTRKFEDEAFCVTARYDDVANVEVDVRAKSLSKVDEAERRTPTAVEVGRIANWESNVQSFVTPPEPSVPQVNLPVLAL